MSASALKSTMQGVGGSQASSGHSILPMNVVAQKVVPGTESSASMKPLSNSGMSYTMLQPPTNQPLSLVQDHRAQVYQNQNQNQTYGSSNNTTTASTTMSSTQAVTAVAPAETTTTTTTATTNSNSSSSSITTTTSSTTAAAATTTTLPTSVGTTTTTTGGDKESSDKLVTNGVESTTLDSSINTEKKQSQETNRNNNSSPDNTTTDTQQDVQKKSENCPIIADQTASPQVTKVEESLKAPVNNGSKESEPSQKAVTLSPTSTTSTTTAAVTTTAAPSPSVPATPVKNSSPSSDEKKPSTTTDDSPQKSTTTTTTPTSTSTTAAVTTTPVKSEIDNDSQTAATKVEQKSPTTPRVTQKRKPREIKDSKMTGSEGGKPKRNRVQTQPYQSPLPEIALIVKETLKKSATPNKNPDDKLIVFYKNEFLAVRNSEGSFYVCQAMQNIYKSSRRIRIRWLSQDKNNGEIYSPDFYDFTDFDCILTNLNLNKIDKNKYQLTKIELLRTENILKRAIDVEAGVSEKPSVTEEHPDGLDLSLFKDESQLKRRKRSSGKTSKRQRKRSKHNESSSSSEDDDEDDDDENEDDDEDEDGDDSSSSDEDDEKKRTPKTSRGKRTTNKALALAKSLVKVPNRANRALLRGTRTNPTEDSPATTSKPEVKKTVSKPTTSAASTTSTAATGATSPRTKLRGSAQANEQESSNNSTTGRAKRAAATTGVSSTDNTSSRKKSQSST